MAIQTVPEHRHRRPRLPVRPEGARDDAPLSFAQRVAFIAKHDQLRQLWIGRTTSVIGDRMFAVGMVWLAWTLTRSSAGVACVILAESVPFMLWGALQRRVKFHVTMRTLVLLDLVRAALLAGLFLLPLSTAVAKATAVLIVGAVALSTAIFEPTFRSVIPELAPTAGRSAYASFDLGARLARIAGPLFAAGITWLASPRILIAVDLASFLVSAACLSRIANAEVHALARQAKQTLAGISRLQALSHAMLWANCVGTFALIVWWLALPTASSHYQHGATTYGLSIGASAAGGIAANLALSRRPDRHDPAALSMTGWALAGVCVLALIVEPHPVVLLAIAFVSGASLCAAALGFSYHAASLDLPIRNQLFQRDQVMMRMAGALGAVASGIALQYRPHVVLITASALMIVLAGWIWASATSPGTHTAPSRLRRRKVVGN